MTNNPDDNQCPECGHVYTYEYNGRKICFKCREATDNNPWVVLPKDTTIIWTTKEEIQLHRTWGKSINEAFKEDNDKSQDS